MNKFFQITAQNMVFAFFAEGLLNICDKLSNPLSNDVLSFSEFAYDSFMFNNIQAMRGAFKAYDSFYPTKKNQ
jgi:hypothetical protein